MVDSHTEKCFERLVGFVGGYDWTRPTSRRTDYLRLLTIAKRSTMNTINMSFTFHSDHSALKRSACGIFKTANQTARTKKNRTDQIDRENESEECRPFVSVCPQCSQQTTQNKTERNKKKCSVELIKLMACWHFGEFTLHFAMRSAYISTTSENRENLWRCAVCCAINSITNRFFLIWLALRDNYYVSADDQLRWHTLSIVSVHASRSIWFISYSNVTKAVYISSNWNFTNLISCDSIWRLTASREQRRTYNVRQIIVNN